MDILKARKKAAERKQERKEAEPIQAPIPIPAEEPVQEETSSPAEQESRSPVQAAEISVENAPAAVIEEHADEIPAEDTEDEQSDEIDMLSFRLGGEAYAVLVKDVREVLKNRALTPVPNAPPYILGVTALRGAVLPVIDLCVRFGLASGQRDEKSRIIVVKAEEDEVGLVVDRVTGVLTIMPDAIRPTPENIEQGSTYLSGIVRKDEKLYILLDLDKAVGK